MTSTGQVAGLSGTAFINTLLGGGSLDNTFFATTDPNTLAALSEPRVQEVVGELNSLLAGDATANAYRIYLGLYFLRAAAYVDYYSDALTYSAPLKASVVSLLTAFGNHPNFYATGFESLRSEWCVVSDSWYALDEQVDRVVQVLRRYLDTPSIQNNGTGYQDSNGVYALLNGIARTSGQDAGWTGKYSAALMDVLQDYAVNFNAPASVEFIVLNAIYTLGHLRSGDVVAVYQGRAHQILSATCQARVSGSDAYLEALMALQLAPFNSRLADGAVIDIAGYKAGLEQQIFANTFTYDSGTMIFRTPLTAATAQQLYDALHEVRAQFFRQTQALRPVDNDSNTKIILKIYGTRADYQKYQRFLYDLGTDNGGIYIEGQGTFYTYERTPAESIYTLEELTRHEYTHYLDGFYLLTPRFGQAPFYSNDRLTWHSEGLAEFLDGSRRTQGIPVRQRMYYQMSSARMTIAQIIGATYSSGFGFYPNAAIFFQFLYEQHPEKLWAYFRTLYNNSVTDYDTLTQGWRNDANLQSEYAAFLVSLGNGIMNATRPVAENFPTSHRPVTLPEVTLSQIADVFAQAGGTGSITGLDGRFRFDQTEQISASGATAKTPELFLKALSAAIDQRLVNLTPVAAYFTTVTGYGEILSMGNGTATARVSYEGWYQPSTAPSLATTVSELRFNSILGDETTDQFLDLILTNTGASPLTVSGLSILGTNAAFFELIGATPGQIVPAGCTITVRVRVKSAAIADQLAGSYGATLVVDSPDSQPARLEVPLWAERGARFFVDATAPAGGNGSSWTTAFQTISAAIAAAPTGREIIFVADGSYAEAVKLRGSIRLYGGFSGRGAGEELLIAQSQPDRFPTIISGALPSGIPAQHVVDFTSSTSAVLDGFKITGGWAKGTVTDGGGLYFTSLGGTATVRHCWIDQNIADRFGAGACITGAKVLVEDCVFTANRGARAGGVLVSGSGSLLNLRRCVFAGNVNTGNGVGGGLRAESGAVVVGDQVQFLGNRGYYSGGFSLSDSPTSLTLRSSVIAGNEVTGYYAGGEVGNGAVFSGENCAIYRNRSSFGGIGTIYGGKTTLKNSLLVGNTAGFGVGFGSNLGTLDARHCLFFGNGIDYSHSRDGDFSGFAALSSQTSVFTNIQVGDPRWVMSPVGSPVSTVLYDSVAQTTTLTIPSESFEPGALRYRLIEAGPTRSAVVQDNTRTTITVFGQHDSLSQWSTWRLVDFHLAPNSPAIDTGMAGTDAIDPDRFPRGLDLPGIANGAGNGTDIGLYEYRGNFTPGNLLRIQPDVGRIRLTWPVSLTGWQISHSTNLKDWVPVSASPTINGDGDLTLTVPADAQAAFFRLEKP